MYYYEWLFLLGIVAVFLLAPVVYGLGRAILRLNPDWRKEIYVTIDTLKINGLELERILNEQVTTIR